MGFEFEKQLICCYLSKFNLKSYGSVSFFVYKKNEFILNFLKNNILY